MLEKEKFSIRRFVSVMTLCTFLITGFSGLVLLLSHESHAPGGILVNWKGIHEIVCIFFVIIGIWHFILNFKVLCTYFTAKDKKISFRMDWVIPVVLAIVFFTAIL
ncbi:hypothetical protein ACFL1N_11785, partial [Thermodesulfobacteriota bacterium]